MHRFQISSEDVQGERLYIRGSEAHHLARVLRLSIGDEIAAFDNSGIEYGAKVQEITSGEVQCEIISCKSNPTEAPLAVYLLQGLPKGDKMETIIQKTTELGVKSIYPVRTSRAIVQLEGKKAVDRVARWQKIAVEAAKQCGRSVVPLVGEIQNLKDALRALPKECVVLAAYEGEKTRGLAEELENLQGNTLALFIGPEGGFDPQEINFLEQNGVKSVSLGPRILRTETAGLAALTMALYQCGDLGRIPAGGKA
jgi:16S rRNA (uracil1498-N3)-methyltransferase